MNYDSFSDATKLHSGGRPLIAAALKMIPCEKAAAKKFSTSKLDDKIAVH